MAEKSDNSFHYGGQAVIEGVMMRGKKHFAVACRRANGEIEVTSENVEKGILGSLKWLNKPFLRGTLALVDSLMLGMKSLMWSANIAMADEEAKAAAEGAKTGAKASAGTANSGSSKVTEMALGVTMFISLGFGVLLFMYAPALLTNWITKHMDNRAWKGLIEGGIKLTLFFGYVLLISFMKDIRRVFQYHGAEHKVINAYEAGEELTVPNVQKYSTVHVRCGTSFLLIVILVSVLVFAAVPWKFAGTSAIWLMALKRAGLKLLLLPFVAGISYEILKIAGNRKESKFLRFVLGLGLLMQRITTKEPADDQVEVAIKSFEGAKQAEESDPSVQPA